MKYIVGVCLGALVSFSAFGYEADYFTRRTGFQDSTYVLNQKMNETLFSVGVNSSSCDEIDLHRDLIKTMGGLFVSPVENWASEIAGNYKPPIYQSIYAGLVTEAPFLILGCCATLMRVGDTLVSGDKLGHFFQSGYEMYFVVRGKSAQPLIDVRGTWPKFIDLVWESPMAGPQIEAIMEKLNIRDRVLSEDEIVRLGPAIVGAVSDFQENGSWGSYSTAVKSYADMAANYGGYTFWTDLTRGKHPYFTCQGNKWHLNREFDWRAYVTDAWDEAINCNEYTTPRMKSTIAERVSGLAQQNGWASASCPVVPAKCAPLAAHYGEVANYILHPDCRTRAFQGM